MDGAETRRRRIVVNKIVESKSSVTTTTRGLWWLFLSFTDHISSCHNLHVHTHSTFTTERTFVD